ncbi:MAG: fibronectin type III domain-containing protein [Elusimicrobia bacterium]|nr:fibronectin type III domain-containing protein [Elusimicrobiota bacterium]
MKKSLAVWGIVALLCSGGRSGWAAAATLAWDANSEADLAGYRLYQSTYSLLSYSVQQVRNDPAVVKKTVSLPELSVDAGSLSANTTYYFRLTAFNGAGAESGFNVDTGSQPAEVVVYFGGPAAASPSLSARRLPRFHLAPDTAASYLPGGVFLFRAGLAPADGGEGAAEAVSQSALEDLAFALVYSNELGGDLTGSVSMEWNPNGFLVSRLHTKDMNMSSGVLRFACEMTHKATGEKSRTAEQTVSFSAKARLRKLEGNLFEIRTGNVRERDLRVKLPDNAEVSEVEISSLSEPDVRALSAPPEGLVSAYDISIPGRANTVFQNPATLTLPYNDADGPDADGDGIADGDGLVDGTSIDERNLQAGWFDGSSWRTIGGLVDAERNTVTVQVTHFSLFAVMEGKKSPAGARAEETILSPALQDGINDVAVFGAEVFELFIFDFDGRDIFHAAADEFSSSLSWNGQDKSGRLVPAGLYIAKIRQKDGRWIYQKMLVVK